ncbi:unnamed protein product [Caenorhabditis auriculariae]|uniref:Uncharacterized protein n=1 Tax=Caenorhabditis auriculariae TaxID=2777116 RepID=A0A8S1HIJ4_9PELO|nr:unnamed protein product [Caenorhabditis auriculariae]
MRISVPFQSKILGDGDVAHVPISAAPVIAAPSPVEPPEWQEPKCFGKFPAKVALYVFLGIGAFFAIFAMVQRQIVSGAMSMAWIVLEVYGIYNNRVGVLLASFIIQCIGLVCYACLAVFVIFLFFYYRYSMHNLVEVDPRFEKLQAVRHSIDAASLIVLLVLLIPAICRWTLTWQVYLHAKKVRTSAQLQAPPLPRKSDLQTP